MNKNTIMNLVTIDAKVATVVSDNNVVAGVLPFGRRVEPLIEDSIKPESRSADSSTEL